MNSSRKTYHFFTVLLLLLVAIIQPIAQKDSLLSVWQNNELHDTIRYKAMDDLIWDYYIFSNPDSALILADQLIGFCEEQSLLKRLGKAYSVKGNCFYIKGEYLSAIDYYNKAVTTLSAQKMDNTGPLNNLGACYIQIGNIQDAIKSFEIVRKNSEKMKDWKGYAGASSNLGAIYLMQEDFSKALSYFHESLAIRDTIDDLRGKSESLSNIGLIYSKKEQFDSALIYHLQSLTIDSLEGNLSGMVSNYSNISSVYLGSGDLNTAKSYNQKSLDLAKKLNDKKGIVNALNGLSNIYLKLSEYNAAQKKAETALEAAREISFLNGLKTSNELLYKIYKAQGKAGLSLECYENFILYRDSLKNEELDKKLIELGFQYEYEKKVTADSLIQSEKLKQNNLKLEAAEALSEKKEIELISSKRQSYYLTTVLVLLVIFAFFIYNRFKVTQKQRELLEKKQIETEKQRVKISEQHEELEETHKEISDSIKYAERLQLAILPSREDLFQNLGDSFVLFKPKDVVSGDFYWMQQMDEHVFFAVADCTGHGVPGAMISVVCSNALNRAVKEFALTAPNEILNKTRDLVIETFARSGKGVKDGMDIALCRLGKNEVVYSGANNPLWIVRKTSFLTEQQKAIPSTLIQGNISLIEYKSDKQPVGLHEVMTDFTQEHIGLFEGDTLYIFTDGFADQFGGEKGKKFKYKPFKQLLLALNELDMNARQKAINDAFSEWKGSFEQIDDVCIIGIRKS